MPFQARSSVILTINKYVFLHVVTYEMERFKIQIRSYQINEMKITCYFNHSLLELIYEFNSTF